MEQLLDKRNTSMLAHGFTPVSAEVTEEIQQRVHALCTIIDPDFPQHLAQCTFHRFG